MWIWMLLLLSYHLCINRIILRDIQNNWNNVNIILQDIQWIIHNLLHNVVQLQSIIIRVIILQLI